MINKLKILQISIVDFSALKSKFKVKERTRRICVVQPSFLPERLLKIRVPSSDNKDFIRLFESIFFFPLRVISAMWKRSEFSLFLFGLFFIRLLFRTGFLNILFIRVVGIILLDFLFRLGFLFLFLLVLVHNLVIVDPL